MKISKPLIGFIVIVVLAMGLGGLIISGVFAPAAGQKALNSNNQVAEDIIVAEKTAAKDDIPAEKLAVITTQDGTQHRFGVELAITEQQRAKGMMYRTSMPENEGMLFIFDANEEQSFWMRNTLIPLDMIFINADGTIHKIHKNAVPHDTKPIFSEGDVPYVMEINGGLSDILGIAVGDRVDHQAFNKEKATSAPRIPTGDEPLE